MTVDGMGEILAVGFDIDGTLYRSWRLDLLMIGHFLRYNQFFLKYGLVRAKMHKKRTAGETFWQEQAALMARAIGCGCTPEMAARRLDKIAYNGLVPFFKRIPLCKGVEEVFAMLKAHGVKIALLSDLPPQQKGDLWGLVKYVDVMLGTEDVGQLKPGALPFQTMAKAVGVPVEKMLYVGNSAKYDVQGAKACGMKCAHFESRWRALVAAHVKDADFSFDTWDKLKMRLLQE